MLPCGLSLTGKTKKELSPQGSMVTTGFLSILGFFKSFTARLLEGLLIALIIHLLFSKFSMLSIAEPHLKSSFNCQNQITILISNTEITKISIVPADLSPVIRTTTKESFPYKLLERRTQDEAEKIYRRTDYQGAKTA